MKPTTTELICRKVDEWRRDAAVLDERGAEREAAVLRSCADEVEADLLAVRVVSRTPTR